MAETTFNAPIDLVVSNLSEQLRQALVRNAYLEGALVTCQQQLEQAKAQLAEFLETPVRQREDPAGLAEQMKNG